MTSWWLLVVCLLAGDAVGAAQPPRVRPMDGAAAAAFGRGQVQSGHFRALVAEIDASNLIVHVVTTMGLPPGVSGTTRLAARLGETRYVRIELASTLGPKMLVSMLAHELQHACELARSHADTANAVRALYLAIGKAAYGGAERFETSAAERAGRIVWVELGGPSQAHAIERE